MRSGKTGPHILCTMQDLILIQPVPHRMAASREKLLAHRKKKLEKIKSSVKLVQPIEVGEPIKVREKIKVHTKSALIAGEGRSMGMDID